jgi:pimeloyl-ACP methyl ester carboxylesterase
VLLLPGGLNRARSYQELMAQPALAGVRLVAATLPGHGGTARPPDFSIETAAGLTAELGQEIDSDVVVGFSIGATVALEMSNSGAFSGPVILLGLSLSPRDESRILRVLDRLGTVMGSLPFAALRQAMGSVTKRVRLPEGRRAELLEDLRQNTPAAMRELFHNYLQYLGRHRSSAIRLSDANIPAWIVHAEKGDGGLTDDERRALEAGPNISVLTIPGTSLFIPNEEPELIATLIVEALGRR